MDESKLNYRHRKKGVINKIFGHQIERAKKKEKIYVSYTKEELTEWMLSQTDFHIIYDLWVKSGFVKELKPSIDRIDNHIGYEFGNIQIMTFAENRAKGHRDCRIADISSGKPHRGVVQIDSNGIVIGQYISINEASRVTGIGSGNISSCVNKNKKQHKAGGYKWMYKD